MKHFIYIIFGLLVSYNSTGQEVEISREAELMDERYSIAGTGFLEQLDNGDLQFRLSEDFRTPAGPDVRLILNSSVSGDGGTELADLSAINHFEGPLTIDLPSSIDINDYDFVVFYCLAFRQLWASGEFEPNGNAEALVCETSDVINANGSNAIDICPSDNNNDLIRFENSLGLSAGVEYVYLITDANQILSEVVMSDQYDFEGSGTATQRVYGMHYAGELDARIGANRLQTTASDCFEHSSNSDFITITKSACASCDVSGVSNANGSDAIDICPSDNSNDLIRFENSLGLSAGDEYVYLITDSNEILSEVVFDNEYNFEGSGESTQRVYGMHYSGALNARVGASRLETTANGCFEHSSNSEFISVTKNGCAPEFQCLDNQTSSANTNEINICPSDGLTDNIILTNNLSAEPGINYAFLITDSNENVEQIVFENSFDFEGSGSNEQRVYGVHFSGTLIPQIGANRNLTVATECHTHSDSDNFLTIIKEACPPEFICLSSSVNFENVATAEICASDDVDDVLIMSNSIGAIPGENYAYLITDANDILLDVVNQSSYNFEQSEDPILRIHGIHYDGNLVPRIGQDRLMTMASECFEHTDGNQFLELITNVCEAPFECQISLTATTDWAPSVDICPSDQIDDFVSLRNSLGAEVGINYAYLITDSQEILQEVTFDSLYNFEGSSDLEQRVYGIHFDGTLQPAIGEHRGITTASGCFTHSGETLFLTISKNACVEAFTCLDSETSISNATNSLSACTVDGIEDVITLSNSLSLVDGGTYAYLLTDGNDILQSVHTENTINLEGSTLEEVRIYGIHFDGALNPAFGQDRRNTTATECFVHSSNSSFVTIINDACEEPFVCQTSLTATTDWATSVNVCPNDGIDDVIVLRNNLFLEAGTNYAYLITDAEEILQEVTFDSLYNFEGSSLMGQRVYGIHFDGTLQPVIGEHRRITTASGCFTHSGESLFLSIEKEACEEEFVCVETETFVSEGTSTLSVCASDGQDDFIAIENGLTIQDQEHYAYLITDANEVLQFVSNEPTINIEGVSDDEIRIYGIHFDGTLNAAIGQNRLMTTASGCFAHSSSTSFLRIENTLCTSIFECQTSLTATTDWATSIDVCPNDAVNDFVDLRNNLFIAPGVNYAYLITDEEEIVQEVTLDSIFNFEGSLSSVQRVYGIHYEGTLIPVIGEHRTVTTATGCFIHSGDDLFLTVTKNACQDDFVCVETLTATFGWVTEVDVCVEDGVDDLVLLQNNVGVAPGANYAFLLTDEFENLQEVILDSLYDFDNSGVEEQRIYGMSYSGTLNAAIGENRKNTTASGCFIHSGDDLFLRLNKVASCAITSTSDLEIQESINIFPNPSYGTINIDFTKVDVSFDDVSIYNMEGKKIKTVQNENQIHLENPGIYFVHFSNSQTNIIKKIIIQ